MKSIIRMFYLSVVFSIAGLVSSLAIDRDAVYQTAPFQSLSAGIYDGLIQCASLGDRGDFGLGTFNALDGEMICVDSVFYQVKQDGRPLPVPGTALTPFAMMTFFDEDQRIEAVNAGGLAELGRIIDRARPTKNLFYALHVEGVFDYIKARSVPAQKKPYRPLADAINPQISSTKTCC